MIVVPELEALTASYQERTWSEEDDKVLLSYHGRVLQRDIAKYLGRSVGAVKGRLLRLKEKNDGRSL